MSITNQDTATSRMSGLTRTPTFGQRRGLMWVVVATGALVTAALVFGAMFWLPDALRPATAPRLAHTVARGELRVTVTETGDLESASNEEIKCLVKGGSTILWIVDDGAEVTKGDVLCRLDASKIEDEISQQTIALEKARAAHIQAESDAAVAELAVTEYLEGTYRAELQLAQSNIAVAEENLRTATNQLEHTERMFRKGYVSSIEKDAQIFAVEHARLELDLKKTEEDVLRKFKKTKMLQELKSALKAARAKVASEAAALELEQTRLERLQSQKENCTIHAPQSGMVIYPETYEWSQEPEVKEGAAVREQQTLIQLPDLNKMQIKVQIHEARIDDIKAEMSATAKIQDRLWSGEVISISNRAEQSGWWSGSKKEFATIVKIEEPVGLKPGMSGEVEILVAKYRDVLTVPVAAVFEHRDRHYCWVETPGEPEIRPIVVGASNDQFVLIEQGVQEGERVVLNPRSVIEEAKRRALSAPAAEADELEGVHET